jgi:hypothetical protein
VVPPGYSTVGLDGRFSVGVEGAASFERRGRSIARGLLVGRNAGIHMGVDREVEVPFERAKVERVSLANRAFILTVDP